MNYAEIFGSRKPESLPVPGLSCGVVCVILRLAISVKYRLVTDSQTDRHTHTTTTTTAYTALYHGVARNKNCRWNRNSNSDIGVFTI